MGEKRKMIGREEREEVRGKDLDRKKEQIFYHSNHIKYLEEAKSKRQNIE